MGNRPKRPAWFKLWLHHRPLIDAIPDEVAGRAFKAALYYFETGKTPPMEQLEAVVFASIRADIDEANADYQRDVENGRRGKAPKQQVETEPPVRGVTPPYPR